MTLILRLFLIFSLLGPALGAQVTFSQNDINLGNVGSVYEIRGDIIVTNKGEERVHLLRAKAETGVTVFTSKRTLQPGDTALLVISFQPENKGHFSKSITLFTSEDEPTHRLSLSGEVENVKRNDLTDCYSLGSRRLLPSRGAKEPVAVRGNPASADSHGMRNIPRPLVTNSTPPPGPPSPPTLPKETGVLASHVPNNIVLLLDISASMRDSLKLPLMKLELHRLIDAIRDVDSISLVTYNDSVKVRLQAVSGNEKQRLHAVVEGLKARGMTKGKKAILFTQDLAQQHYIKGGNNIMFLASDGEFRFTPEDQKMWDERQSKGTITISTVAFGGDRDAHKTLRQIAERGGGSFINLNKRKDATSRLLQEVELRSRPVSDR